MAIVKTEAFVLKSFKYGETSKIVTLFTKDLGKLNAIVKGARNFKSRICGTLESMNYVNVVIYLKKSRELQQITNAEYIKSFSNLTSQIEKLEAAFRIIEILNKSLLDHDINKILFDNLLITFNELNNAEKDFQYYVLYFQIQLALNLGLGIDFNGRYSENETFFPNKEFYLNKLQMNSLKMFAESEISRIRFLEIDNASLMSLINCYEKFLSSHTNGYRYYHSSKVFQELNFNF